MIQLVDNYATYVESIPELIRNTHYKASYFLEKLKMPRPTYYRKLKENTFTIKEVALLTEILFPKQAYRKEFLESIAQGKKDIKEGNTFTSEEVFMSMDTILDNYQKGLL